MINLNAKYLKKHIDIIERDWKDEALAQAEDLLNINNLLYVLSVDIKKSTALPLKVSASVVDLIRLTVATEIQARGGIVFRFTDGVDSFFTDGQNAFRSALSIYHRKKDMQEKVLSPLLKNIYKNEEPEIKASDIDYRVFLCIFPFDFKNRLIKDSDDELVKIENLSDRWKEAISRVANDESFLISKKAFDRMRQSNLNYFRIDDYFNTENLIRFESNKPVNSNDVIFDFFGEGFYSYANPDYQPVAIDEVYFDQSYDSSSILEEVFKTSFQRRKELYRKKIANNQDDHFLFDHYLLEKQLEYRLAPSAFVIGDINVDYITYLSDEQEGVLAVAAKSDTNGLRQASLHQQLQQDIKKRVAGKGLLMAETLSEHTKLNPIYLSGKLGQDKEMYFVIEYLKNMDRVAPLIFLSNTLPTGTSISIRRIKQRTSIITITDKANANSELTFKEVNLHLDQLKNSEFLFISGYCLLDDRFDLINSIVNAVSGDKNVKIILDYSPAALLHKQISQSENRAKRVLELMDKVFLICYEEGAFGKDNEYQYVSKIPFKLRFSSGMDILNEQEGNNEWKNYTGIAHDNDTLGLFNKYIAKYIADKFLKPKILLISQSPRRYSLLSSIYGHSMIYQIASESKEFDSNVFASEDELKNGLIRVAAMKLITGLRDAVKLSPEQFNTVKVAISSDLIIVRTDDDGHSGNKYIILDKPDSGHGNAINIERTYLKDYLIGKTNWVWSATCFISCKHLINNNKWLTPNVETVIEKLENKPDYYPENKMYKYTKLGEDTNIINDKIAISPTRELELYILLSKSTVEFRDDISDREINEYIASGEWRTKAGGYAIQGNGTYLVKDFKGTFTNIIGLPLPEVASILDSHFLMNNSHK